MIGGLLTRLGSLGISSVMVVALATVHLKMGHPFVAAKGGPSFELPAVYLACAIMFFILGPGKFSLDALVFGKLLGPSGAGPNEIKPLVTPTEGRLGHDESQARKMIQFMKLRRWWGDSDPHRQ